MSAIVNAWQDTNVGRFLMVTLPLANHVYAALAVGQALVEAGHDAAWCGPETDLRPHIGLDAQVFPSGKRNYRRYAESGMAAVRALWDGYLTPFNRFILEPVDKAVTEYRPDVVVADQYALAAGLTAHRHGLRWASLCTGALELAPPTDELPELEPWVREQVARVWARAGLPVDEKIDLRFSPYLVIALTTPALIGAVPLPERCVLVGPALGRRPADPAFPWDAWDPGRRHVLVTVGTMSEHMSRDFYTRMAQALEPLEGRVQAVFIAAPDTVPEPPRNALIVPQAPMLELLPRLDAVVCHAGMGTVTESLAHGVPLVVAPIRVDQPVVARQVAESGAGLSVSFETASSEQLAAALIAVLDEPRYREGARRIADSFAAAGGAAAAAAHLAALAADG
jgi:UDP:flavonoid glycosyltransferase YjiC (YdhE family)